VSFAPRPLYPGKDPLYSLDRKSGGPQSRSERHGEVKILAPNRTQILTPLKAIKISVIGSILDLSIFISLLILSSIL
jgi:hypothetical protein